VDLGITALAGVMNIASEGAVKRIYLQTDYYFLAVEYL
jgi:hypothetical protein